ncbi:MAG: hypothetical protein GY715_18890 [Planctomycetes bacterium]|nr:hypothetical protein [Planctomycetota bacterium]
MTGRFPLLLIVSLASLLLAGCGSDYEAGTAKGVADESAAPTGGPAPDGGILSNGGTYYVVCKLDSDPIPLNEPFGFTVTVYEGERRNVPVPDVVLLVDGRMPDHRHGMNREPTVRKRANGSFVVEDMLFHMPGFWELHMDVMRDGMTERAQLDVNLQ